MHSPIAATASVSVRGEQGFILAVSTGTNHLGRATPLCPSNLDFNLLSDGKCVIDLDATIPHRTLDFGVPKQELYRA